MRLKKLRMPIEPLDKRIKENTCYLITRNDIQLGKFGAAYPTKVWFGWMFVTNIGGCSSKNIKNIWEIIEEKR